MITLADGKLLFPFPEKRIREYCKLEVYQGYDDFHSIDNTITKQDIEATKRIFSMIDQHGHSESNALLKSPKIPIALSKIPDVELGEIEDSDWQRMKENIASLFEASHQIEYVGLAKTAKILHLKRPHLFPILDSYVVEFLTGVKLSEVSNISSLTILGVQTLEIARKDIIQNLTKFKQLKQALHDLPIPLTTVRMYDILCWTTWKWDVLGKRKTTKWVPTSSGYIRQTGYASKTLLDIEHLKKIRIPSANMPRKFSSTSTGTGCTEIDTLEQFDLIVGRGEGFIVILDTTGNKIHRASCKWIKRDNFNEKVIINKKRNGRYFWCGDHKDAMVRFRVKGCRTCM